MNQQALENRAYVRNLILAKYPRYAYVLTELVQTPLHMSSAHFNKVEEECPFVQGSGFNRVIGFGACQTDRYPPGAEEWEL